MSFTPEQIAQLQALFAQGPTALAHLQAQAPALPPGVSPSVNQQPTGLGSLPGPGRSEPVTFPPRPAGIEPPPLQIQPPPLSQIQPPLRSQTQTPPTGINTQAHLNPPHLPPITQLYRSHRAQQHGHPAPATQAPPSFHPFFGTGLSLNTTSANQNRLASSSTTIPRQVALPRRGRRGPSRLAPSLQRISSADHPKIDNCIIEGAPEPTARVRVRVFPPKINPSAKRGTKQQYLVHRFIRDSVDNWLRTQGLLVELEVPLSALVSDFIEQISAMLMASSWSYEFSGASSSGLARHEALPMKLLCLVNRGTPRQQTQEIGLQEFPVTRDLTFTMLASDKMKFSGPACIETQHWAVYLGVSSFPLVFKQGGRVHRCLSRKFFRNYGTDRHLTAEQQEEVDNSLIEFGDASSDEEAEVIRELEPVDAGLNPEAEPAAPAPTIQPLISEPSFILSSAHQFIPSRIWKEEWLPREPSPLIGTYDIEELTPTVYRAATSGSNPPALVVTGSQMDGAIAAFLQLIDDALARDDFTDILSPDRDFSINYPDGRLQTYGPGIEREILHTAWAKYATEFSCFFAPRYDGKATLQTSRPLLSSHLISQHRLGQVRRMGALCALILANGQCPEPLNPLVIHFLVNKANIHCLTESIIKEWHPQLHQTITSWNELGHEGDPSPFRAQFASYHDTDVSLLRHRDEATHESFAAEMLYFSIIGTEPPFHPEWKAFRQGFSLKCRNGFTFNDVPLAYSGGSDGLISVLWTSVITSYASIKDNIRITRTPVDFSSELSQLVPGATFRSLVISFLEGSGVPCPALFEEIKDGFSPIIDLSSIDDPKFRPRALFWAATGCPTICAAQTAITISIASDDDPLYAAREADRPLMLAQGKISFRTCTRALQMPAQHILRLAQASYPGTAPLSPFSFQAAFEHWLLSEILCAIGGHSML